MSRKGHQISREFNEKLRSKLQSALDKIMDEGLREQLRSEFKSIYEEISTDEHYKNLSHENFDDYNFIVEVKQKI